VSEGSENSREGGIGVPTCRVYRGKTLHKFLSLGLVPLANRFLREDQLSLPEPYYPSEPQNPEAICPKNAFALGDEGLRERIGERNKQKAKQYS